MASPLSARRSSLLPPSSTPPPIEPRSSSPAFIRSTLAAYREQLSHCPSSTDAGIDEEEKEDEETRQRCIRASFREGLKHGFPARGEEASSAENGGRAGRRPSEREERENLEILRLIALHEEIASAWLPRRLILRLYLAWFLWRSTLRMRGMLSVLGFVVEAAAAWFLLILVPAQLAFEIVVRFNWVYGIGYGLDAVLLAPRIYHLGRFFVALSHHVAAHVDVRLMRGRLGVMRALQNHSATAERRASQGSTPSASPTRMRPSHEPLWSPSHERARQSAPSGAALAPPSPWRSGVVHWPAAVVVPWNVWEVVRTLPVLPYDVCLWGTSAEPAVPWVRVIRALVYWYTTIDRTAAGLERSPRVAFTAARVLRVVNFFILAAHWLGCLFFLACRQRGASHYASSVAHFQQFHAKGQDGFIALNDVPGLYMRSIYWGFMTLTTTGHVDVISDADGNDWEVIIAVGIILFATLVYIYLNANFTALMLRMTTEIDRYRTRIGQVDAYLQRNNVSKQTARMVRKHFRGRDDQDATADKLILSQMPLTLQKRVLRDIYSHTLRRVPLFTFGGADPALIEQICTLLRPAFLLADENVCKQGELAGEIYFLEEGKLLQWEAPETSDAEELEEMAKLMSDPMGNGGAAALAEISARTRQAGGWPLLRSEIDASSTRSRPNAHSVHSANACAGSGALADASAGVPRRQSRSSHGRLNRNPSAPARLDSIAVNADEHRSAASHESSAMTHEGPRGTAVGRAPAVATASAAIAAMQQRAAQRNLGARTAVMMAAAKVREALERAQRQEPVVLGEKGSVVGEVAVLFGVRHIHSVEAVKPSKVLILDKSDLFNIMRDFPAELDEMRRITRDRLRRKNHPVLEQIEKMEEKTPEVVHQLSDLMFAASDGDMTRLRHALNAGVAVNSVDHNGATALHVAAGAGHVAAVRELLEAGANVDVQDMYGNNPLQCALKKAHVAVIQVLRQAGATLSISADEAAAELCFCVMQGKALQLKLLLLCGADVNAADYDKRTALHVAAAEGNLTLVQLLVSEGATLSPRDRWLGTPLGDALKRSNYALAHWLHGMGAELGWSDEVAASGMLCELARNGMLEKLRNTIMCGADVNVSDYDLRTPLHLAAAEGRLPCAQLLVDSGADVNAKDRFGATPLREAIQGQHIELARMLRSRGAELGLDEAEVAHELQTKVHKGLISVLRLLLDCGADPNARDFQGRTALHVACSYGRSTAVGVLVDAGADVNAIDSFGYSPLRDAVRTDHVDVADVLRKLGAELFLGNTTAAAELCTLALAGKASRLALYLRCGANPDAADHDSRTALHVAAAEGNLPCVKVLVNADANASAQDRWGGTPLQDALRHGHTGEVAMTLHEAGGRLNVSEHEAANQLCFFASQGLVDPIATLVRLGANINVGNVDRRTPLHVAAAEGHKSTCICLLDAGASIDSIDRWGNTPVAEAERSGLSGVFDLAGYYAQVRKKREMEAAKLPESGRKWIPQSLSFPDKAFAPWFSASPLQTPTKKEGGIPSAASLSKLNDHI